MTKQYTVEYDDLDKKQVIWDSDATIFEVIEAAHREFPGTPFDQLTVFGVSHDVCLLILKQKD